MPMLLTQGRCCCGDNGEHYKISYLGPGAQNLWLKVEGDRLVPGSSDVASGFAMTLEESGKVKLSVGSHSVAIINGAVRMSEKEAIALSMDFGHSGERNGYTLRTTDGWFLSAGESVSLTKTFGPNVIFGFERAPHTTMAHWAADEGHAFDESHNTHLWIFNRACDLIDRRMKFGGVGQNPGLWSHDERTGTIWCLSFSALKTNIMQGIYDADNLTGNLPGGLWQAWASESNPHTTGFVYSAHFWNHTSGAGGSWDLRKMENNAYKFGTYYWQKAVEESDPAMSGYYLGLAIHYLEDLTQPMHCGVFANWPPFDWRHANYEAWAVSVQSKCAVTGDLVYPGIPLVRPNGDPFDPGEYWRTAGKLGLGMFNSWKDHPGSPLDDRWRKVTPNESNVSALWLQDLRRMLGLAQQLVANLLVSYALFSKVGKGRVSPADLVLLSISQGDVAVTPEEYNNNANKNCAYSRWINATSAGSTWALEPVLQKDGTAMLENGNPVYYIRNKGSNRCIVAWQDTDDGNIYYQDPAGRSCAQWVMEITGSAYLRPKDGRRYPVFRLRDKRWDKRYLIGSKHPGTGGPLKHGDLQPGGHAGQWIQIPVLLW